MYGFLLAFHGLVTMAVSCIVSEKSEILAENRDYFIPKQKGAIGLGYERTNVERKITVSTVSGSSDSINGKLQFI